MKKIITKSRSEKWILKLTSPENTKVKSLNFQDGAAVLKRSLPCLKKILTVILLLNQLFSRFNALLFEIGPVAHLHLVQNAAAFLNW